MIKKVTALKARKNLGELLEELYYGGDQYVIERAGKPMAAIMPLWQLEAWLKRREEFFDMVDEMRRRPQEVAPEVIEQEIQEAIQVNAGVRLCGVPLNSRPLSRMSASFAWEMTPPGTQYHWEAVRYV